MNERKILFRVEDNVVVKDTPVQADMNGILYKTEIVIDKATFQECYRKWIGPQERDDRR